MPIHALAAKSAKAPLEPFSYDPGPLGDEHVEIAVTHCGICHSDLSMLHNDWGMSAYPFVPGHEVCGTIAALGSRVTTLKVGQRVGLGWFSQSCMSCHQCMTGNHNLCPTIESTIVHRYGGFADRVRAHHAWCLPLPAGLDPAKAGPLFCGGITVFNPIIQCGVLPTQRAGVIGIGGLGHLALQFLNKWGCEVTAFTSDSKKDEALQLGAHHAVSSRNDAEIKQLAGSLDFILVTANATLNWELYLAALAPKGRLHFVGAVLEPIAVGAFSLIGGQKAVSGSPLGSPAVTAQMLEFCTRHKIAAVCETYKMSQANEALARLESGKARFRIVLENDLR
jgi:uncharacterized zinc-type alcohol dehydrogenase-like protein